jgi:hypothetical protein
MKPVQVMDALYSSCGAVEEERKIIRGQTELRLRATEERSSGTIRLIGGR